MTSKPHVALIVPGLGDDKKSAQYILQWCLDGWAEQEIYPIVFRPHWLDQGHFEPKLQDLLKTIDHFSSQGRVSLVGLSAGGSAVMNAFMARSTKLHRAVNVGGRLREGNHQLRSLKKMSRTSPAFYQSVKLWESQEAGLSHQDRQRVLSLSPLLDETVPPETTLLKGADHGRIWWFEHTTALLLELKYARRITSFLNQK